VERRKAMRFRSFIASQAMPEARQDKVRLAALHAPHCFRGVELKKRSSRMARERMRVREWLFENRIWNER
jgi:hypothetical protein